MPSRAWRRAAAVPALLLLLSATHCCAWHSVHYRGKIFSALHSDLLPWTRRKVNATSLVETRRASGDNGIAGFALIDGRVFMTSLTDRRNAMDTLHWYMPCKLLQAMFSAPLGTNLEVFVKAGDRPVVNQENFDRNFALVVSPASVPGFLDVRGPHWFIIVDHICEKDYNNTAFDERKPVLFGRYTHFCPFDPEPIKLPEELHAFSDCQRTYFAQLAKQHPSLMDVGPTNYVPSPPNPRREYGAPGTFDKKPRVPLESWDEYKYVLATEGWTFPGKLAKLLALGGVVLIPRTKHIQYFVDALEPGVHFVPVWEKKKDDVIASIEWLERNKDEARKIAAKGREFACMALIKEERDAWWTEFVRVVTQDVMSGTEPLESYERMVQEKTAIEITANQIEIDEDQGRCTLHEDTTKR